MNMNASTSDRERHTQLLLAAELQFRLASAVRLAVSAERQPLDLPIEWTHGRHRVKYAEVALRRDQADYAARLLQQSATYLMAVAVRDAIRAVVPTREYRPIRTFERHTRSLGSSEMPSRMAHSHRPGR